MYEEITARAMKRLLSMQLEQARKKQRISKNRMAKAMRTSRASLDRLLDPENHSVTLSTIAKAAHALGKDIRLSLSDAR